MNCDKEVKIIGITGDQVPENQRLSGKLGKSVPTLSLLPQDNYYRSATFISNENITAFNFDHPDAFDMDLLFQNLYDLKLGKQIQMPQYDFVHHRRKDQLIDVEPKPLVIIEGLMVLYEQKIRDLLDLKLYVDTPDDIRFIRRLKRDIAERGENSRKCLQPVLGSSQTWSF